MTIHLIRSVPFYKYTHTNNLLTIPPISQTTGMVLTFVSGKKKHLALQSHFLYWQFLTEEITCCCFGIICFDKNHVREMCVFLVVGFDYIFIAIMVKYANDLPVLDHGKRMKAVYHFLWNRLKRQLFASAL